MEQRQEKIIIFNSLRPEKDHRKTISIKSSITIEQLRQNVKQVLQIDTYNFKLYFHTFNLIYLQLDSYYFEYFRNNLKINKLIKVVQYSPLQMALSIVFESKQVGKKQSELVQNPRKNINNSQVQNLVSFPAYELKQDYTCSFFADDICQIANFLQTLDLPLNTEKSSVRTTQSSSLGSSNSVD